MNKIIKLAGTFLTIALVIGLAGAVNAATLTATITAPASGFSTTIGQTVTFTGTATGGNGPYDYVWNFSEGTEKGGASATYVFTSAGTKNVTLTVSDSYGATATKNVTVTVATSGTGPVISAISATNIAQTSVTIVWTTDVASDSRVIYDTASHPTLGTAPNYGYVSSTVLDGAKVTSHSVNITGLSPSTKYYFRVISSK